MFVNLASEVWHFDQDPDPAGYSTVTDLSFEIQGRSDNRSRHEDMGVWPGFPYLGGVLIHVEGMLLAPDPTVVNNMRLEMLRICMPAEFGYQANRILGRFQFRLTGQTEDFYFECTQDAGPGITNSVTTASSARLPYQLTFMGTYPYATGVTSETKRWVA